MKMQSIRFRPTEQQACKPADTDLQEAESLGGEAFRNDFVGSTGLAWGWHAVRVETKFPEAGDNLQTDWDCATSMKKESLSELLRCELVVSQLARLL